MKKRTISLGTLVTVILAGAVGIGWLGLGLLSGYHGYFAVGVLSLLGALVWWVRGVREARQAGEQGEQEI